MGAVAALVALGAPASASAQGPEPVIVPGTATCPEGFHLITRFDPVYSYAKDGISVVISDDRFTMDWTSTVDVDVVIVKGGENANMYTYDPAARSGTDLRAPLGKYNAGNRISWAEFCSDEEPRIDVTIVKTGVEATATAGSVVNFTISVSNTGNTSFTSYVFDDPACDEKRTGANAADKSFDPGDTWTYSCAMPTTAGATEACNTATVSGSNAGGMTTGPKSSTACIPLTPPAAPPTTNPPGGGVLPDTSKAGAARLLGPSGCVKQAFKARVRGRSIAQVSFFVDGKLVKRIRGERAVYKMRIRPSKYGFGRHRVVASVRFTAESGTAPQRLRLTFRRCNRGAVQPRFTG